MTLTIQKERVIDYEEIVEMLYSNDEELISKYHVLAPSTVWECVDHTVARLKEVGIDLDFYGIYDDDYVVGYFAIENKVLLTAFGIMPPYRTKETAEMFWSVVHATAGDELMCALYNKNTRGQNFLMKHGAERISSGRDAEGNEFKTYRLCRSQHQS